MKQVQIYARRIKQIMCEENEFSSEEVNACSNYKFSR